MSLGREEGAGRTIHYAGGVFWFDGDQWGAADGFVAHCTQKGLDGMVESGFDYCRPQLGAELGAQVSGDRRGSSDHAEFAACVGAAEDERDRSGDLTEHAPDDRLRTGVGAHLPPCLHQATRHAGEVSSSRNDCGSEDQPDRLDKKICR